MDKSIRMQIESMIQTVGVVLNLMESGTDRIQTCGLLMDAVEPVNELMYGSNVLEFQKVHDLSSEEGIEDYVSEIKNLISIWNESLKLYDGVDEDFWRLYEYFKYVPLDMIIQRTIIEFKNQPEEMRNILVDGLKHLVFLDNKIDEVKQDYALLSDYMSMMKDHVEDFKWLYERLEDYRSRYVLIRIVRYWMSPDIKDLINLKENMFDDYYDLDLISVDDDEVLVDCGAYIGDSIQGYVNNYGFHYKRIYAYEMSPRVYEALCSEMENYRDVVCRQAGVGGKPCKMYLKNENYRDAASLSEDGETCVDVVTMDEDIAEPISIIKMDIEGAEMDALEGAREHIKNEKPRLLISAYHRPADIFDIPKRIVEYRDDYKLYLRYNGHVTWPADFIVFGV